MRLRSNKASGALAVPVPPLASRWAHRVAALFRRDRGEEYTLAVAVTAAEGLQNSVVVHVVLEGSSVEGPPLATKPTDVNEQTGVAAFADDEPLVTRVSSARGARVTLTLRSTRSGSMLGTARLDVAALVEHGGAQRLRLPIGRRGAILSVLALAVPAPEMNAETSWDSPSNTRRESSHDAPCAPGHVSHPQKRSQNDDADSHLDAATDLDDLSLDDLSSIFQDVDTAQPWPLPPGRPSSPVADRLAKLWCAEFDNFQPPSIELDETVITRGPIEYI